MKRRHRGLVILWLGHGLLYTLVWQNLNSKCDNAYTSLHTSWTHQSWPSSRPPQPRTGLVSAPAFCVSLLIAPTAPGGKGTVRRKIVRKTKPSAAQDDKKLQGALKKLNVQPIPGVEEVNMFREDGNVLHFTAPKGM